MRSRHFRATLALLVLLVIPSSARSQSGSTQPNQAALDRVNSPPLGLPAVPVPVDNPVTLEKISRWGTRKYMNMSRLKEVVDANCSENPRTEIGQSTCTQKSDVTEASARDL